MGSIGPPILRQARKTISSQKAHFRTGLAVALLFALFFGARLIHLSSDPPDNLSIDSASEYGDPGNYAFNARAKVVVGDWKIDELGAAAFSPIPHALTYLIFSLWGTGIWQMNLVPLIFAMLLWLALDRLAKVRFPDARLLFFALLAANYAFGSFSRINDQVMPMTLFAVVALIFFLKAWDKPRDFFWTAFFLGLSFLSKSKMIYFSAGVIPLAFVLITIQRGELKQVRRHLVRLAWALAGILVVFVPWYLLIFAPHPKVFGNIAALNSAAAVPPGIGGLIKNWIVRPAFTFFPANAALALPLFFYFFGLLAAAAKRRRLRWSPLEIVCALWFVIGVGINSFIGYRPVRHYIECTIPLLILVSLFLRRFLRGIHATIPSQGWVGLVAGSFALFWIALSASKHGVFAWGLIDHDPITVLEASLVLAAVLTVLSGLVLGLGRGKAIAIPRTATVVLTVLLLGVYAYDNASDYAAWVRSPTYNLKTIGRDLGRAFPEGVFSGLLVPTLSLENRNPAHTMYPHYANDDPGFLDREHVTHLFLGAFNNERRHYDKLFPEVMEQARLLVSYRMWRSWWLLYDIRAGLPPEDTAVYEAEAMERNVGMPVFDPQASGRFAVRVESADWGTIGRERIPLTTVGPTRGAVVIKPEGDGPLDVSLSLRLSLKGRTVLKKRIVLPKTGGGGDYITLPFEAWIDAPGNYVLEIKAVGTGAFLFDRVELRPKSSS